MIETYCKICNKTMNLGDSMLGHIIESHPNAFADLIIEFHPSIVMMIQDYYGARNE